MVPRLSSAQLTRLAVAQRVLLSPLDYDEPGQWCAEACRAIRELVGMERGSFLRSDGDPVLFTDLTDDVIAAYLGHYCTVDVATQRALRRGLEVAHLSDVMSRREHLRSELFHDFAQPNSLRDAMIMQAVTGSSASAWICLQHAQPLDDEEVEIRRALLEAVHPAFSTGLALWNRLAEWRMQLGQMLDALGDAILVCDPEGGVLHATPAFTALLEAEPERDTIQSAVEAFARSMGDLFRTSAQSASGVRMAPNGQTVRTRRTCYHIRGNMVGRDLFRPGEALLITLHCAAKEAPSAELIRRRFGLTRQEVRIALLLAQGLSNAAIAGELAISPHTVRRHTERVLHKLNVSSRAQIAARLQLGGPGRAE